MQHASAYNPTEVEVMLEKLLGLPAKGSSDLFSYLPVSTSLEREIE